MSRYHCSSNSRRPEDAHFDNDEYDEHESSEVSLLDSCRLSSPLTVDPRGSRSASTSRMDRWMLPQHRNEEERTTESLWDPLPRQQQQHLDPLHKTPEDPLVFLWASSRGVANHNNITSNNVPPRIRQRWLRPMGVILMVCGVVMAAWIVIGRSNSGNLPERSGESLFSRQDGLFDLCSSSNNTTSHQSILLSWLSMDNNSDESTNVTVEEIQTLGTPQQAAWEWLQDDTYQHTILPTTTTTTTRTSNHDDDTAKACSLQLQHNQQVALQRFALATLYFSTQPHSTGTVISHNTSECQWFASSADGTSSKTVCNRYHQVQSLSFWEDDTDDDDDPWSPRTLPPELSYLSSLQHLNLSHRQLKGSLPARWFSEWKHLETVDVRDSWLTGSLPTQLGSLAHAKGIWVHDNQLAGHLPSEMGLLVGHLKQLDAHNNRLSGSIPSELGGTTRGTVALQELVLNTNFLTGFIPSELGRLTQLTRLELHMNRHLERQELPVEIVLWYSKEAYK